MRFRFFLIALIFLPAAVSAQTIGDVSDNSFSISTSPQFPAPYSTVTFSFSSLSLNLANATLTVSVGGKEIYRGSVQPVEATLGRGGSATTVRATITSNGASYHQAISIQPQDVLLIAEPAASVPPLYLGKPFAPINGNVRVVAVANLRDAAGKTLDPAAVSYEWTVDGTYVADSSGIGRSSVLVASPLQYRKRSVSVVVTSQDGALVGGDSLSFSPLEPSVRIYENDPLLGIRFEHALTGTYTITGTESSLYAAAFSMPLTDSPLLQWFLNGENIQTGSLITLRPTGKGEGSATLSFTASNGDYSATQGLGLSFGSKNSSFFGL